MTGVTLTPSSRRLGEDTINDLMVVQAWLQSGLITMDRDSYLHFYRHVRGLLTSVGATLVARTLLQCL